MFKAGNVAGSTTYKQSKTVWNDVVLQTQFVYLVYPEKKTKSSFN